ncbi:MAG: hypothetical protein JKY56_25080 [Kofleriaceae bacterium]|nr:hypothetical protein [Kofleriaceae bacterium]
MEFTGKHETLTSLSTQLKGLMELGLTMMKHQKETTSDQFLEGLGGIMAYHNLKNLIAILQPQIEGETMTLELPMAGGGVAIVAVGGIISAGVAYLSLGAGESEKVEAAESAQIPMHKVRTKAGHPCAESNDPLCGL